MNPARDDLATVCSIGLLAYLSADVAHHALGHGAACLALGGSIASLSSIFVNCSVRDALIDLAGPVMNAVVAAIAFPLSYRATRPAAKMFWGLVFAFNLLWFEMHMVFSLATKTDDWAWALQEYSIPEAVRYAGIGIGLAAYFITTRIIAIQLAGYASPRERLHRILVSAWATAAVIACATAAADHSPIAAILKSALPQSAGTSVALLFVAERSSRRAGALQPQPVPAIRRGPLWIIAAAVLAVASIVVLGPGIKLG